VTKIETLRNSQTSKTTSYTDLFTQKKTMALKLHHVDPPRIPEKGWFTDTAMDIISGGDKELADLLKSFIHHD
jgi:hypothetical protein